MSQALSNILAEIVGECAQADSPAGVQRSKTFGAELEAAEASNVLPLPISVFQCLVLIRK